MALFRAGSDEAFRVIHDRYRQRLFAYTRQMLPGSRQDAEDALQDVFVRAYSSLRSNDRKLALRAWLYRVAHNRCIDELRRPAPPAPEMLEFMRAPSHDPIAEAEQRESLRRLIEDVRRLPEQQRSALLMRELSGMSYCELASALGASVPAVKSLLVRARVGLAAAQDARDTACSDVRDELILAHDRRVRPNATARRHLTDCAGCREFRGEMRSVSRQLAALVPTVGPAAVVAKALGIGGGASGGAAASGSAAAGSGAAVGGGAAVAGTGAIAASGALATGASHVATLLAAAVITASGAVGIQSPSSHQSRHHARHHVKPAVKVHRASMAAPAPASAESPPPTAASLPASAPVATAPVAPAETSSSPPQSARPAGHPRVATAPHLRAPADSVMPSSGVSAPVGTSQTGGTAEGASGTGSATGSNTTEGTSTTTSASVSGTTTSTSQSTTPTPNSSTQAAGSSTQTVPPATLPQTSASTSTSTASVAPADASSDPASGSSTAATGTSGSTGATH